MKDLMLELKPTSLGWLAVTAGHAGICWVSMAARHDDLWSQAVSRFPEAMWKRAGKAHRFQSGEGMSPRSFQGWMNIVEGAVEQPRKTWKAPLQVTGTPFQEAVWKALQAIPAGSVMTYGQLASVVGHPGAARAVGSACGANPVPFLIPCHRIVASGGGLGGFGLGLDIKRALLAREGASRVAS